MPKLNESEVDIGLAMNNYRDYVNSLDALDEPDSFQQYLARTTPDLLRSPTVWERAIEPQQKITHSKIDLKSAFFDKDIDSKDPDFDQKTAWRRTILEEYVEEVANKIQFPHDTAYLFSLGVVASAMTRQFSYRLNREDDYTKAPVNLYVITAQPAGTAKSGVFRNLTVPVQMAYAKLNEGIRKERAKILATIDIIKADMKSAKNANEKAALTAELTEKQEELKKYPVYVYAVDDATAEGLRDVAARQKGFFNMVSEEADLVKVVLGNVYGDGSRKTNNSIFLKAWDGDIVSVARAGQDIVTTPVKATLAVIAQDESIRQIMEAGQSGQGINERVMIMREPDMLDRIDFRRRRASVISPTLRAKYHLMCERMVHASPDKDLCDFYLSDGASEALIAYMEYRQMAAEAFPIFKDPAIMGVVSKAEKQICKLASVLHGCMIYSDQIAPTKEISESTIRRAAGIFDQLLDVYASIASRHGYAGSEPRIERVMSYFERCASKGRYKVMFNAVRDAVRMHDSFARCESVADTLRKEVLPELIKTRHIVMNKNKIYINPVEFIR